MPADDVHTGTVLVTVDGNNDAPSEKALPSASPGLPLPVTATKEKPVKSARIERAGLRVHWARFKQRLGTSSILSESLLDGGAGSTTDTSVSFRKPMQRDPMQDFDREADEIDEIVVDQLGEKSTATPSEPGTQEREKSAVGSQNTPGTTESMALTYRDAEYGIWESYALLTFLRWRLWHWVKCFFQAKFKDEKSENQYRKETFLTSKSLAFWSTSAFIINWIVVVGFAPRPFALSDNIIYWGIGPLVSFPLPVLVLFDIPYKRPLIYQIYLFTCVWIWPIYQVAFMTACHFFPPGNNTCGSRDFISLFYYALGLPFIAMLSLFMSRLADFCGAFVFIVLTCVLTAPRDHAWVRNIVNASIAHGFLLYIHWRKEGRDRRLFSLREQLKTQFRATQQAQINERKSSESKRKLTSYIFHEVRVPLNTALLAVQNLEATSELAKDQLVEWTALQGSLATMSKVLNDILDFNRLDSGRFSTVQQPYKLHQAIRSLITPLHLTAANRGLSLVTTLDPDIDEVARRALYAAQGYSQERIESELLEHPDEPGIVIGDEQRLRQVLTNLTNNACKFTNPGGHIKVVTKLISPTAAACRPPVDPQKTMSEKGEIEEAPNSLSHAHVDEHNSMNSIQLPPKKIIVRIEVHDTGVGIRPEDLVDHKLFSPYVQTEIGKYQGGKGSGLGLALVRRIVKRCGGRLGVKSKWHKGSQFWVELPLGVGEETQDPARPEGYNSDYSSDYVREPGYCSANKPKRIDFAPPPTDEHAMAAEMRGPQTPFRSDIPVDLQSEPSIGDSLQTPTEVPAFSFCQESGSQRTSETIVVDGIPTPGQLFTPSTDIPNPPPPLTPPDEIATETPNSRTEDVLPDAGSSQRPAAPISQPQRSPRRTHRPLKVLVVDDDDITRKLMSRMLSRIGCVVETAENGQLAVEKVVGHPISVPAPDPFNMDPSIWRRSTASIEVLGPQTDRVYDIVFLDNQMPVMSGIEAVRQLRKLGRTDLVVGVTGNALLSDQQEYLSAGVNRVLTKPVLERSLREMLQIATELRDRPPDPPSNSKSLPS